jgi:hypothetical protein
MKVFLLIFAVFAFLEFADRPWVETFSMAPMRDHAVPVNLALKMSCSSDWGCFDVDGDWVSTKNGTNSSELEIIIQFHI